MSSVSVTSLFNFSTFDLIRIHSFRAFSRRDHWIETHVHDVELISTQTLGFETGRRLLQKRTDISFGSHCDRDSFELVIAFDVASSTTLPKVRSSFSIFFDLDSFCSTSPSCSDGASAVHSQREHDTDDQTRVVAFASMNTRDVLFKSLSTGIYETMIPRTRLRRRPCPFA